VLVLLLLESIDILISISLLFFLLLSLLMMKMLMMIAQPILDLDVYEEETQS